MKNFKAIIAEVLRKEPTLTGTGLHTGVSYESDPIEEEEFKQCMNFLKQYTTVRKNFYRAQNSYWLKHASERWYELENGKHKYISNGAMILALLYLGVPYRKYTGEPNIYVPIKIQTRKIYEVPTGFEYAFRFA